VTDSSSNTALRLVSDASGVERRRDARAKIYPLIGRTAEQLDIIRRGNGEVYDRVEPVDLGSSDPVNLDVLSNILSKPGEMAEADRVALWRRAFAEPGMSLEDLEPFRVRLCWRACRYLALITNVCTDDETLMQMATASDLNPWTDSDAFPELERPGREGNQSILGLMREPTPLSLMPPQVPSQYQQEDTEALYRPENRAQDEPLHRYLQILHTISVLLNFKAGTPEMPESGRYGMAGLMDPRTIRLAFPSIYHILGFEQELIGLVVGQLIDRGEQPARQWLAQHHGLTPFEVTGMMRMAKAELVTRSDNDVRVERAVMAARLDSLADRARDDLNLRVELLALKQMSAVLGITRTAPEDENAEMVRIVDSVAKEDDRRSLPVSGHSS